MGEKELLGGGVGAKDDAVCVEEGGKEGRREGGERKRKVE